MKVIGEILQADRNDLNRIIEAVKSRREMLALQAKAQFAVGDRVSFPTRKRGTGKVIGIIQKINRKNLVIDEDVRGSGFGTRWTIHPSLVANV